MLLAILVPAFVLVTEKDVAVWLSFPVHVA